MCQQTRLPQPYQVLLLCLSKVMRNSSKLKYLFVNIVFSTTTSFHVLCMRSVQLVLITIILLLLLRSNDQCTSSLAPLVYPFKSDINLLSSSVLQTNFKNILRLISHYKHPVNKNLINLSPEITSYMQVFAVSDSRAVSSLAVLATAQYLQ